MAGAADGAVSATAPNDRSSVVWVWEVLSAVGRALLGGGSVATVEATLPTTSEAGCRTAEEAAVVGLETGSVVDAEAGSGAASDAPPESTDVGCGATTPEVGSAASTAADWTADVVSRSDPLSEPPSSADAAVAPSTIAPAAAAGKTRPRSKIRCRRRLVFLAPAMPRT
jgi:hypothetical protein